MDLYSQSNAARPPDSPPLIPTGGSEPPKPAVQGTSELPANTPNNREYLFVSFWIKMYCILKNVFSYDSW